MSLKDKRNIITEDKDRIHHKRVVGILLCYKIGGWFEKVLHPSAIASACGILL